MTNLTDITAIPPSVHYIIVTNSPTNTINYGLCTSKREFCERILELRKGKVPFKPLIITPAVVEVETHVIIKESS